MRTTIQQYCRADIFYKLVIAAGIATMMFVLSGEKTPVNLTVTSDAMVPSPLSSEVSPNEVPVRTEASSEAPGVSSTPRGDPEYTPDPVRNKSHLVVGERHERVFLMNGSTFAKSGPVQVISTKVKTYLIHSFSPYVEREAMKRFLDPPRENVYFANSPAILFYKGDLLLVSRIWLDKEKYRSDNAQWPANNFADNWFYYQRFDDHLEPISPGEILGIPTPKGGQIGDGPIEPRLFTVAGKVLVTFNTAMAFKNPETDKRFLADYTAMWDLLDNTIVIPMLEGGSSVLAALADRSMPRDKHWMALVQGEELYFVQVLDPLKIMHCTLDGFCKLVYESEQKGDFVFRDTSSHLRGGTPFELYKWPYYISVAHTTFFKDPGSKRYYASHIVVLSVSPYRLVYVSSDILLHQEIYDVPMVRHLYIEDGFLFPVGLIIEDLDTIAVGGHINDHSSVVVRVRGIRGLMDKVIKADTEVKPQAGPPVGSIQQYIHSLTQNETIYNFYHTSATQLKTKT